MANLGRRGRFLAWAAAVFLVATGGAGAQTMLFVSNWGNGTIGEYDTATGDLVQTISVPYTASNGEGQGGWALAVVGNTLYVSVPMNSLVMTYNAATGTVSNSAFITGLNTPLGLNASGNTLYVSIDGTNKIATYNATTGALLNGSFVTVPVSPYGIATGGNTLYVTSANYPGYVGAYNATTGATINASLVSNVTSDYNVAVSGNHLFVSYFGGTSTTVAEYDATTGALLNGSFVTGIAGANAAMAISGNDLFVSSDNGGTISEYDATTGALIDGDMVSGLDRPIALALYETPEPSTWALLFLAGGLLLVLCRAGRPVASRVALD